MRPSFSQSQNHAKGTLKCSDSPIVESVIGKAEWSAATRTEPSFGVGTRNNLSTIAHLLGKNATIAIVDQFVASGTRFLATVLIGRACGPDSLGLYTMAFAAVLFFGIAQESLLSLPYSVFVQRSSDQERKRYTATVLKILALLIFLLAAGCSIAGAGLWQLGASWQPLSALAFLLAIVTVPWLFYEFCRRALLAQFRFRTALALDVSLAILHIGGIIALWSVDSLTVVAAFLALAVASGALGIAVILVFRAETEWSGHNVVRTSLRHWRFGKWCLMGQLVGLLHGYVPYWLLVAMTGITKGGLFAAAQTIVLIVNPAIVATANLLTPYVARAFALGGVPAMMPIVFRSILGASAVMALVAASLMVAGDWLLVRVFGEPYAGQQLIIALLGCCPIAWAVTAICYSGLATLERVDTSFGITALCTIATGTACLILIPHWEALGATVSLLLGSFLSMISHVAALWWVGRSDAASENVPPLRLALEDVQ